MTETHPQKTAFRAGQPRCDMAATRAPGTIEIADILACRADIPDYKVRQTKYRHHDLYPRHHAVIGDAAIFAVAFGADAEVRMPGIGEVGARYSVHGHFSPPSV